MNNKSRNVALQQIEYCDYIRYSNDSVFYTTYWNLSYNNNNPENFQQRIRIKYNFREYWKTSLLSSNRTKRQQNHLFCHSLLILTVFNFFILIFLKNNTQYFYYHGRIFNKILTIFIIYTQLIYLHHNFCSLDQQKGKLILGTFVSTSKFTKTNTEFFAKVIILSFTCYFLKIICSRKSFNSTRFKIALWAFTFIAFHHNEANENIIEKLKYCTKSTFFSTESIFFGNSIYKLDLLDEFIFLILIKIKKKDHPSFFQSHLLCSGDLSLNPGPTQIQNDIWEAFKKRGLHFLHININSLLPKIDELRNIASNTNAAVIGITESKLDSSVDNNEVSIAGYNILRCDRNRNGGGVAFYIRSDICYNEKTLFSKEIEHVFVDLFIPKVKVISVGVFYRPPTQGNFLEILIQDFRKFIEINDNEVYILGDFNINLFYNETYILKENQSCRYRNLATPLINKYKEFCQTFSLKQIIRNPTRITCNTSSLLDHILSNSVEKISNSGVINVSISDHQLIYFTRKILRCKSNTHQKTFVRCFKNYSVPLFNERLFGINFPNYDTFSNIDIAYSDFLTKLLNVINSLTPKKERRIKNNSQEWFDNEVFKKIRHRNTLFENFKNSKSENDKNLYREAQCNVRKLVKSKKRNFYQTKLEENIGKPKELWKTLKSLGLPSKKAPTSKICLKTNDTINFDDSTNASIFKNFYSNLAENLVSKLPTAPKRFEISSLKSYYEKNAKLPSSKFKLAQVSKEHILEILQTMDPNKAAGIDEISGKFLKDGSEILAKPISQICNLSIKKSKFPSQCKIAKVTPLFKKGSKTDPKNYRPISLLPIISKVIEKVVHEQTEHFLHQSNVTFRYQSGFRRNFSTDWCLSYLNDKILNGFDSGLFTGMILIDLQKAFDTINHDILIKKMKFVGFSEDTISWFNSYLSTRQFKVSINNSFSNLGNIKCGVPQGSILGPLLFLIYINDISQSVKCEVLLYADDTCLLFQHKDVLKIKEQLNKNFKDLCHWFLDNKLSVHFGEDKTKSILFGSKHKIKNSIPLDIEYNNTKIKQYRKVTYLGCILDDTLSGESMAHHVINKVNSRLKFLYRQDKFLNKPLRRLLCNAMIQPFFDYACIAWYPNLTKNLKERLQSSQNKCLRYCLNLTSRASIKSKDFEEINWLNIHDRYNQMVATTVFKFFNARAPDYLDEIYFPADQEGISTRFSFQKLKLPLKKTNMGKNSLSFTGPFLWNKLPNSLKSCLNVNNFKHSLKEYFILQMKKKEKT